MEISVQPRRSGGDRWVVQATLAANGTLLRAEDRGENVETAIDRVHDLLERRIRDFRDRIHDTRRQQLARHKAALGLESARAIPDDRSGLVMRVKSHETKPLFVEDAIDHMDLLGHDFFFFSTPNPGGTTLFIAGKRADTA